MIGVIVAYPRWVVTDNTPTHVSTKAMIPIPSNSRNCNGKNIKLVIKLLIIVNQ